jgi:hypothetical protein
MAQFGDEPDIQVVHARGIVKDNAPPCWRSGNEVGVVHSEFSAVGHEDVDGRKGWAFFRSAISLTSKGISWLEETTPSHWRVARRQRH